MAYRSSEFEDRFYDGPSRRADVRFAERESERDRDRLSFLRDDPRPQESSGPLVLRQREVETRDVSRPRQRSPSPQRYEHMGMVRRARSLTPPHVWEERERDRIRIADREKASRAARYIEPSPSPPPRFERRRSSSVDHDRSRSRVRIIERERERVPERVPSPSPSPPPPPPPVIRGPTIEREVITHYRDIDHGVIKMPQVVPAPPRPAPRPTTRTEERHLDIDIRTSHGRTDVDVRRSASRHRSPSRERRSPQGHGHELVLRDDRLRIDDRHYHGGSRRRAHSAAPLRSPVDEEAEYITSKIDSRGRMGEAWNGATKDWTIVDVPPGTERVKMDGVGGGAAEVTWQRYNGVRRSNFIPEREGAPAPSPAPLPAPPSRERERGGYERELEIEISRDRRSRGGPPPSKPKQSEMWTEITKDLVSREAIQECGYDFEETEYFFYVMQYLKYDNVLELVKITEDIERHRRERAREKQRDREWRDYQYNSRQRPRDYDERIREREVVVDSSRMRRGY